MAPTTIGRLKSAKTRLVAFRERIVGLYVTVQSWLTRSSRSYHVWIVTIAVLAGAIGLALAVTSKASGLYSDDYDYLNKSVYYIRGDFGAHDYLFTNRAAGILYPIGIAVWMLATEPSTKFFLVWAVNCACFALTVYFGSRALWSSTNTRSLWFPLLLAAFPPAFGFVFYASTESMFFAVVALATWLMADLDKSHRSWPWMISLILTCVAAPLIRPPGLVLAIAAILVLLYHGHRLGWRRVIPLTIAIAVLTVTVYQIVNAQLPLHHGHRRELKYIDRLGQIFTYMPAFISAVRLFINQYWYVLIATAYFPAAVWLFSFPRDRSPQPGNTLYHFSLLAGLGLMGLALLHVFLKIPPDPSRATLIYGRYVAPGALAALLGGVCQMFRYDSAPNERWLLRFAGPVLLCFALARVLRGSDWWTPNQLGFHFMTAHPSLLFFLVVAAIIAVVSQQTRVRFIQVGLIIVLIASTASCYFAVKLAQSRGRRVAYGLEASTWIQAHVPFDECIGLDMRARNWHAPVATKSMNSVYRASTFAVWPHEVAFTDRVHGTSKCSYILSMKQLGRYRDWDIDWQNDHYIVYHVDHDRPHELDPADMERFAKRKLKTSRFKTDPKRVRNGSSLFMAWDGSTARSKSAWYPPGHYLVHIVASATGCSTPPPELDIRTKPAPYHELQDADLERTSIQLEPGTAKPYVAQLEMFDPGTRSIELRFVEGPSCGTDKNAFVYTVRLERKPSGQVSPENVP